MTALAFRNPSNGYVETVDSPGLWTLLFGCFYFAAKGVWTHAVVSFGLAILTCGVSWFIYPFFARRILEVHYLRKAWQEVPIAPLVRSRGDSLRQAVLVIFLILFVVGFASLVAWYFSARHFP
jgi:hypothetical protein